MDPPNLSSYLSSIIWLDSVFKAIPLWKMRLNPGPQPYHENIWKNQVKVVKSGSIPRYQHLKFQILDILPLWKPNKNEKFEFKKFLLTPASHQTKIIEGKLEGDLKSFN